MQAELNVMTPSIDYRANAVRWAEAARSFDRTCLYRSTPELQQRSLLTCGWWRQCPHAYRFPAEIL